MVRTRSLLYGVSVTVLLSVMVFMAGSTRAQSSYYPHHAGVVIKFSDGSVQTACVDLGTDGEASGYDVLRATGVSLVEDGNSGTGYTICKINQDGCGHDRACFCQCMMNPGEQCLYWSYHHLINSAWVYSNLGASLYTVHSGDVEGWGWGVGTLNSSGSQPPVKTFSEICVPPTATPTATPKPASTNTPWPTYTPVPSVQFWVDATDIKPGTCTTLHWITNNMQSVLLNGEGVGGSGTRSLCLQQPEAYTLKVTHPDGKTEERSVGVAVNGVAAALSSVATPTPGTGVSQSSVATPTPAPTRMATPTATPTATPPSPGVTAGGPTPAPLPAAPTVAPVEQADLSGGLMQPTQIAMLSEPAAEPAPADSGALLPTPFVLPTRHPLQGEAASTAGGTFAQVVGYLVFGLLLVGLGSGYIALQRHPR
ncbi:MAG: hypothetical protein RBT47_08215 [Anaerolineae bacterium]|jgi:hypothetical protein|nr:hypothetical protein [Anaerolineae bacterium]